jgi:hypothetical protein
MHPCDGRWRYKNILERRGFSGGSSMNQDDSNFEWVVARAKCSASEVYGDFAIQIKRDVDTRNNVLSGKERKHEISFTFNGGYQHTSLIVSAQTGGRHLAESQLARVIFTKVPEGIAAEYSDGNKLTGLLTLSQDGGCRLKVDGVEYSFWQFRKLILEPIFFDAVKEYRE